MGKNPYFRDTVNTFAVAVLAGSLWYKTQPQHQLKFFHLIGLISAKTDLSY